MKRLTAPPFQAHPDVVGGLRVPARHREVLASPQEAREPHNLRLTAVRRPHTITAEHGCRPPHRQACPEVSRAQGFIVP
ncbi:hypothetical protein NDU88_002826 [Pleurodeles waltl]|uniref:Uncharacterized protein n=1 Tax=Pleurodeles waltl TaxID=8319 RepID=A0AAV7UCL3_PLEWA|nr:hypothetical protein NDU88_002826 [Pleurodeles waltl]